MKFKNGKRLIRRRCGDGCGGITNYGKKYLRGHHRTNVKASDETRKKQSKTRIGMKQSEEHKRKRSIAMMGNTNGRGNKGKPRSDKAKLAISLGKFKCHPKDKYGPEWRDREYIKDLRKDYCENKNCKKVYKRLNNHHIHLDKKRCAPNEIMTLCNSCHMVLHRMLEEERYMLVNLKDFIIINRPDHVSYIRKSNKQIIRIERREDDINKTQS